MRLYQLLWLLIKHALHGRWRDEVFVSIGFDGGGFVTGEVNDFSWTDDRDAFCIIDAAADEPYRISGDTVHMFPPNTGCAS